MARHLCKMVYHPTLLLMCVRSLINIFQDNGWVDTSFTNGLEEALISGSIISTFGSHTKEVYKTKPRTLEDLQMRIQFSMISQMALPKKVFVLILVV